MSATFAVTAEVAFYDAVRAADVVGSRVYPGEVPEQVEFPCIGFGATSADYRNTIHKRAPQAAYVQLEAYCMAQSLEAAQALAGQTVDGVRDAGFLPVNRRSEFDNEDPDDTWWAVIVTFGFWEKGE